MITSGFSVNGVDFRIGAMRLGQENPVLIERWNCRTKKSELSEAPSDRMTIRFSFDPPENARAMLRHLVGGVPGAPAQPGVAEDFADVIETVFGGLAPYPARPSVVMRDWRRCYSYTLTMVVHAVYVEIRANIQVGAPPISRTSVGVVRIPFAYAYFAKGTRDCCEEAPALPERAIYADDWLTDRVVADLRDFKPLESVWSTALDKKKNGNLGGTPQSGLGPPDQGDWNLEPGSPSFDIGPN